MYHIIVSDKDDEKGVLKLLRINTSSIPEIDKLILLFEDYKSSNEIECNVPYIYCVYPKLKIINKREN